MQIGARIAVSGLVERAKKFAANAHRSAGHRRKYSGEPYGVHLEAVAGLVAAVTDEEETIAAAWLHDTVEDTSVKSADIRKRFGARVAALVAELTDVSRPGDGNREARKAIDRDHLAKGSAAAKTVKLADLIDNCRDITENDPKFARVYLEEMGQLLGVLTEGEGRLYEEARRVYEECAATLGLEAAAPGPSAAVPSPLEESSSQRRMRRLLNEGIPAAYIAEALPSFDGEHDAGEVLAFMNEKDLEVVGVRRDGFVAGYVTRKGLGKGACGDHLIPFSGEQKVFADAPLSRVIGVLARHDHCFVSVLGAVGAVIGREDIQKPPVRMWLFGMITILETFWVRAIEELYPDGSWEKELTAARLGKARELFGERRKRGQHPKLLDCLQLSDKARVLLNHRSAREEFGFETAREGKRAVKTLESLRNNLAHAQDIVSHDWDGIVLIAGRVNRIVTRV
jgi:hypothetical protein